MLRCTCIHTSSLFRVGSLMLRILDILGWIRILIRIRGSMPPTNGSGSGSCYFRYWPSRCQQKTNFLTQFFLLITFCSYIYNIFYKDKKSKESKNSRNQGFSYHFCTMIEGSGYRAGSGSGSIPLTSGSGSGRPKRQKHMDPQHWFTILIAGLK